MNMMLPKAIVADLPEEINTVGDLLQWLQMYNSDLQLEVRYDSGYGDGAFTPTSFQVVDKKTLRIEVS